MPDSRIQHTHARDQHSERYLRSLWESHRWFELRDALNKNGGSALYRGAVACVFDDRERCRREFDAVLQSSTDDADIAAACELLIWMSMRRGEFRQALPYANRVSEIQSVSRRMPGLLGLLRTLGRVPAQFKTQSGPSVVSYEMMDGNMFVPVLANGKSAKFMVDSGATVGLITASEAKRLGFEITDGLPSAIHIYGATGALANVRPAVADELRVGECHLKHVTFAVLRDDQFDFPPGYQGAMGLPVLQALETLRWDTKGNLELNVPSSNGACPPNICFDNGDLIVRAGFQGRDLSLVLDTGSSATVLWPPFVKEFPEAIDPSGRSCLYRICGISGNEEIQNFVVKDLRLSIGAVDITFDSVNVLAERTTPNSDWLAGRLGMDALKASRVTLDFKSMSLTLEE